MPTTTKYIWDEQNYLAEADGTDTINVMYTNEPQEYGNLVSTRVAGTTSYHHFDAIGSTRQLTNAGAAKTDSWIYDAWGNTVHRSGASGVYLLWIGCLGYYWDIEESAIYVRRRPVDSARARWTAKDVVMTAHAVLSPYLYSRNAPLNRFDPSGLLDWHTYGGPVPPAFDWGFLDDRSRGTRIVGFCGAFAWITEWVLDSSETDGFIVQKVCPKLVVHDCPRAACNRRPLPGGCTNTNVCTSPCYIELWAVQNSGIFVAGVFTETPMGEGGADIFAYLGCSNSCSNGCTRGSFRQTGEAFFVPLNGPKTDLDWLRDKFQAGVANACSLASACDQGDTYAKVSGMKRGATVSKSVSVTWNCCCPSPPPACQCRISHPVYPN